MTVDLVAIGKEALWVALLVSAPLLLAALLVGTVVGLLQAVTQVQEASLSFLPKALAVGAALFVFLPWMLTLLLQFTRRVFEALPGAFLLHGGGS